MKKLLAAVLIGLAVGSAVFAAEDGKMEMYAKATIGYGGVGVNAKVNNKYGSYDKTDFGDTTIASIDTVYKALPAKSLMSVIARGFEITPAFGFGIPFSVDQDWGAIKFAVEAQVPIVLGTFFAMKPGAMFVANYYFPSNFPEWTHKISPHMGSGFSIPIVAVSGKDRKNLGDFGVNQTYYVYVDREYSGVGVGFCWDIMTGVQYDFNEHISAVVDWNLSIGGRPASSFRAGGIWRF